MARQQNYAALQAKIQQGIEKLRKQADTLQRKKRKPVIMSIVQSMKEFDITPEEIIAAFSKPVARGATRASVPVKYKHPETGATWTGRGKPPRWVVEAEASGKSRNDFLV